jgi:hypothetical protein
LPELSSRRLFKFLESNAAYVISGEARTVTPIRTATSTKLKPIKVGHDPSVIAITP